MSIRVGLICHDPVATIGIREILSRTGLFDLVQIWKTVAEAVSPPSPVPVDVWLIRANPEHRFGELKLLAQRCSVVIWGDITKEFAYHCIEAGARGLVTAEADVEDVNAAISSAHSGQLFVEPHLANDMLSGRRVRLTPREGQLVMLISQGLKNKEVAFELGISEGTVKVYVTKLLRKLELNDRLELALFGLRNFFQVSDDPGGPCRHTIVVNQWRPFASEPRERPLVM